jgi:hypothetical protein
MRDKAIFVGASVLASFVLFGTVALLKASHFYTPWDVEFLLAVMAVMIGALGVPWKRKLAAVALTLGGFSAFSLLTLLTGSPGRGAAGPIVVVLSMVYALVPLIYPLAALALFVGTDPAVLWTPVAEKKVSGKRKVR